MKKKYYVVWQGKKTGIFTSWPECQANVNGVKDAKYKSFTSEEEAKKAFEKGWKAYFGKSKTSKDEITPSSRRATNYEPKSISVDAACSGNPGPMEYQGVYTETGQVLFHYGPIMGTNNIGEFLAIVHGLAYLKEKGLHSMPIYSDSQTAIKWVRMKKANTTLAVNSKTEQVWELIHRAEQWLNSNSYSNPIIKWETEIWGESKADFGRK